MSKDGLFLSEPMSRCQLFLQSEAAYNCIQELGELGLVQFVDLNPSVSAFQRKFVGEVKRCEEMERKLRYIHAQAISEAIPILNSSSGDGNGGMDRNGTIITAPNPREMSDLETALDNIERDLSEVNANYSTLRRNQLDLLLLKQVLLEGGEVLSHTPPSVLSSSSSEFESEIFERDNDEDGYSASLNNNNLTLTITAGVIDKSKVVSFERLLWRCCRGNVYMKFSDIDPRELNPQCDSGVVVVGNNIGIDNNSIHKTIFFIFHQDGQELKTRIKKVCEGYHTTCYTCPSDDTSRRDMLIGVENRLSDLSTVLSQTREHRTRLLTLGAKNLQLWTTRVRKSKAIYHCLNMFSFDYAQNALVAECWLPHMDIQLIQNALNKGADLSGSTIAPILNIISSSTSDNGSGNPSHHNPPTFNRTNKFTEGFQALVDAYGVNSYREANPAVFTIASFPFLFAVMFGDAGHGVIVLLAGLAMITYEHSLSRSSISKSEIFSIFFGGRYIIALMGLFSIYTGLIYNDIFSKSFNIFGSMWKPNTSDVSTFPMNLESKVRLNPSQPSEYYQSAYPLGIDPIWQSASNKIVFLNSYKMKISLIFGLFHMIFGLTLSLWNRRRKGDFSGILLEFIPQLVFMVFIFGYLVFMMFYKWTHYLAIDPKGEEDATWSEHCAPSLLITFINMMLFKSPSLSDPSVKDDELFKVCKGRELYMFWGQRYLQMFLLIIGLLMIPIMLFGKPLYIVWSRNRRRRDYEVVPASSDHFEDHRETSSTTCITNTSYDDNDDGLNHHSTTTPLIQTKNDSSSVMSGGECIDDDVIIKNGKNRNSESLNEVGGHEEGGPDAPFSEIMIYQAIHTIEYVLSTVSHTASYLRLWALSLAHSQLSEVLWNFVFKIPLVINFNSHITGGIIIFIVFGVWAFMTLAILVVMEGLSAFLHTLRLHWVEFQSKFYTGSGYIFDPFNFESYLKHASENDRQLLPKE